uniref:Tumor necrosis factor receptor superfamily member 5 n=1 Tax=Amazona collaria TaxID=241587 RepID=A0A8B9IX97_9PSIT
MQRLGLLGLLCAALLGCWEPGDAVRCFDKQYEYRGKCCNRCHPGEKLVSECSDTENSICTPCESGHYQQSWTKERHCAPHDICEDNTGLIVKTHGNATHNTVCQCRAGTHCSDTSCQTCVENQPCQRGFGFVAAKAMARMSSPCEPCAEGTFSNVSSKTEPCHPWTSCEEKGLMVKVKGTNASDVICESGRQSSLSVLIPIAAVAVTCLMGIFIYYYLVHRGKRLPWPAWPHGAEEPSRGHGGSSAKSGAAPLGTLLGHGCPSPMPYCISMSRMLCPDCHLLCPSFRSDPKQQMQKQGKPGRPEENLETHQPTEEWEDPFPVQETLLRGQPVAQEDGKESRIAEQERL